jgi:hypothetical protein
MAVLAVNQLRLLQQEQDKKQAVVPTDTTTPPHHSKYATTRPPYTQPVQLQVCALEQQAVPQNDSGGMPHTTCQPASLAFLLEESPLPSSPPLPSKGPQGALQYTSFPAMLFHVTASAAAAVAASFAHARCCGCCITRTRTLLLLQLLLLSCAYAALQPVG